MIQHTSYLIAELIENLMEQLRGKLRRDYIGAYGRYNYYRLCEKRTYVREEKVEERLKPTKAKPTPT